MELTTRTACGMRFLLRARCRRRANWFATKQTSGWINRAGDSPSPTQTTCQHGFRRLFAHEASGETIRTTAWAHGIGKWRQHRGSRGAGGRWRREATLTRPVKWVGLEIFAHDGVATGEAVSSDSAREVPQEHRSQDTASARPNSRWARVDHVNGAVCAKKHDGLAARVR